MICANLTTWQSVASVLAAFFGVVLIFWGVAGTFTHRCLETPRRYSLMILVGLALLGSVLFIPMLG